MGVSYETVRVRLEELERGEYIKREGSTSNKTVVLTLKALHRSVESNTESVEPTPQANSTDFPPLMKGGSVELVIGLDVPPYILDEVDDEDD